MSISLEKIDLLKERTGASYKEAKAALEAAGGNVVEALVILDEEQQRSWTGDGPHKEILNKFKEVLKKSTETKIQVKSK
ncbi:MAG: ubiquitin, partial [Firmicutes bacterium HGW-Firmicutes-13]